MMHNDNYIPVVAVRYKLPDGFNCSSICIVPNGAMISTGDIALVEDHEFKGQKLKTVCRSDTVFVDRKTFDMICNVIGADENTLPKLIGKINIDWYTNKEVDNEQALL